MERMNSEEKIKQADLRSLGIIHYPAPRLAEPATPISQFNEGLSRLAERMFELMFAARGVGLAAPQVGLAVRLFVASPTFDLNDRQVYINPQITHPEGTQEGEEGCLSFPGISCKVKRKKIATIRALGLNGSEFERTDEDLAARIFQHETDHLDGRLLVHRMGSVARLTNRRALKKLEEDYANE